MDTTIFNKSSIKWNSSLRKKAVAIAMEAERTAVRLEAGVEQKFGTGEAFDKTGKPVCAFGCILSAAKCVPEEIANIQKNQQQ